jgi:hypothetical protein
MVVGRGNGGPAHRARRWSEHVLPEQRIDLCVTGHVTDGEVAEPPIHDADRHRALVLRRPVRAGQLVQRWKAIGSSIVLPRSHLAVGGDIAHAERNRRGPVPK